MLTVDTDFLIIEKHNFHLIIPLQEFMACNFDNNNLLAVQPCMINIRPNLKLKDKEYNTCLEILSGTLHSCTAIRSTAYDFSICDLNNLLIKKQ